jgi:hypothetical protein
MKPFLLLSLLITTAITSSAQLTNTKWKGTATVPDPMESVFSFGKDSLVMTINSGMVVETMGYELKGDTLVLTKLEGMSPCGSKSAGSFRITWKDDTFTLTALQDNCPERSEAFTYAPWVRQKD